MEKELSNKIAELFNEGMTHQEIGDIIGKPRRTVMRLCGQLGLKRTRGEAASLKIKSPLDKPEIIEFIKENRSKLSLEEIATKFNSSISAVHRLCEKYGISLDKDKFREMQAEKMLLAWTDEKKAVASKKSQLLITDELRRKLSNGSKKLWENSEYRNKQVRIQTEIWNKPENKEKLAEYRSRQSGSVSSIQKILYSILDDIGVKYFKEGDVTDKECIIGPYNFDCVIPRDNDRDIIIECHGDYWHTLDKAIRVDKAKASYIEKYYSNKYELKYLWEHEFACKDRISELIKYWLGIEHQNYKDFEFNELIIRRSKSEEYKLLLSKYHYLPNAGKGGIAYGAYYNGELIAVCVFSQLIRQNIEIDGFDKSEVTELSRLCINPVYQKKNLASWFVSRCIKLLDKSIKCIVSYCDTTFNHDGAVYKSLNFINDKEVRPDYWYANENGWVMHKKTLYNKAAKMSITETEYAVKFGYKRVYGSKKLRFVYKR